MRLFNFVALIILFLSCIRITHNDELQNYSDDIEIEQKIYSSCDAFLLVYANLSSEFIKCAIEHSRPFRLCEACAELYVKTVNLYKELEKGDASSQCHGSLMHANMIHILSNTEKYMVDMWKTSVCQDCFKTLEDINGTVRAIESSKLKQFLKLYNTLQDCFYDNITEEYNNDTESNVCKKCKEKYDDLNNNFENLWTDSQHMCMDVFDIMNYTRLKWSKTYNCSRRSGDSTPVLSVAVTFFALPIVFYVSNRLCSGRKSLRIVKQNRLVRKGAHRLSGGDTFTLAREPTETDSLLGSTNRNTLETSDSVCVTDKNYTHLES